MNRKTRNAISGILVGAASVFAIINFADVPAEEVKTFLLSTGLFFLAILLLAILAVCLFKGLAWIRNRLVDSGSEGDDQDNEDRE